MNFIIKKTLFLEKWFEMCYLDPATLYILSLHLQLALSPSSSLFIYIYLDKDSEPQVNIFWDVVALKKSRFREVGEGVPPKPPAR